MTKQRSTLVLAFNLACLALLPAASQARRNHDGGDDAAGAGRHSEAPAEERQAPQEPAKAPAASAAPRHARSARTEAGSGGHSARPEAVPSARSEGAASPRPEHGRNRAPRSDEAAAPSHGFAEPQSAASGSAPSQPQRGSRRHARSEAVAPGAGEPKGHAGTGSDDHGPPRSKAEPEARHGALHPSFDPQRYAHQSVRERLKDIGLDHEPQRISKRSEILVSPRRQSSIPLPKVGPGGKAWHGSLLRPAGVQLSIVNQHMAVVSAGLWQGRILSHDREERRAGRYYWHRDSGFDYCHYYDPFGFHWYGWYFGSQFFWTRHFGSRWWWYDSAFDRWTYYNEGYWWWQDPSHRDDLYCYRDGYYQPITAAVNRASAAAPSPAEDAPPWKSPDGTCQVKLLSGDAFLYDLGDPPAFDPQFLASGVSSVEYSPGANGQPLEILLKLKDGGFKLFDAQGRPYRAEAGEGSDDGGMVGAPLR